MKSKTMTFIQISSIQLIILLIVTLYGMQTYADPVKPKVAQTNLTLSQTKPLMMLARGQAYVPPQKHQKGDC